MLRAIYSRLRGIEHIAMQPVFASHDARAEIIVGS
jgi:hypothetical protein